MNIRNHMGIRPYLCPQPGCGANFVRADELKRHFWIHKHEQRFACQVCGKNFNRIDAYKVNHVVFDCYSNSIYDYRGTFPNIKMMMMLKLKRWLKRLLLDTMMLLMITRTMMIKILISIQITTSRMTRAEVANYVGCSRDMCPQL